MPFYPGPGWGRHCIPIDPFYLTWKAREFEDTTRFIELAGEINTSMPDYVVDRVAEARNNFGKAIKGSRVLILGCAYKANVDDERESPSYRFGEAQTTPSHSRLSRPARAGHSTDTRTSTLGRNQIRPADQADDLRIRPSGYRDSPRLCKLSGTRRLGAIHCGYEKRYGCRSCRDRKGLEGLTQTWCKKINC
jgi:hypothetical protein